MECPSCAKDVEASAEECGACGAGLPPADPSPSPTSRRGWGGDVRAFRCGQCGAETVRTGGERVADCAFCGAEDVGEQPADAQAEVVQPELAVAFEVPKERSDELFYAWVGKLRFAPGDLKQRAEAGRVRAVLLPFWRFDAEVRSYYWGQVGHDYQEQVKEEDAEGRPVERTETRTRWERGSGWRTHPYDGLLVCASKGVERTLAREVEPWRLDAAEPYSAEALADVEAERYALEAVDAWRDHARVDVLRRERTAVGQALLRGADADRVKDVEVDVRFGELRCRLTLLPVYVSAYRYGAKTYKFMINGQTGEARGQRPYSVGKILLAVVLAIGLVFGLIAAVSFAAERDPEPEPTPAPAASPSPE